MTRDFDRSFALDLFGVGAFALGVAEGSEGGWRLWLGGLGALMSVIVIAWGHSRPLISITPHSLILRLSPLRAPREILFSEVAAYSAQRERLYFHLLDRTRLVVPLLLVRSRQRPALLGGLSELGLGIVGAVPTEEQGPRWYEFSFSLKTAFAIWMVVFLVTAILVLALRAGSPG